MWVTLARAGRGLGQTGGDQGGRSTGAVMGDGKTGVGAAHLGSEEVSGLV